MFDWKYYYDIRGTAWGNTDLVEYWADHGYNDNERASVEFDMNYYRAKHDGANNKNMLNTCRKDGINYCEQASPDFSLAAPKQRYPGRNCLASSGSTTKVPVLSSQIERQVWFMLRFLVT